MDLFEYQGKELLGRFGVPVSHGRLVTSAEEARAVAAGLGGPVVVKAQVMSGGRGKAGGVRVVADADEARDAAAEILDLVIGGQRVKRLWIEPATAIAREYYLAAAFDRGARQTLLMFSTEGGIEIERVAAERPDVLARVYVDPLEGLLPHHERELFAALPDEAPERDALARVVESLYDCFVSSDATLCEINPLVVTPDNEVRALDAKVTIDDAALYRHPDLARLRTEPVGNTLERLAAAKDVTYVKLDGTVGIIGNGAGLSMATVDVVVVSGGTPANFCDLGGGASSAAVVASLEVIAADPQVRAVLLNIFGGITRCDEIARGVLAALDQLELDLPIVVRLDGTNADEGRRALLDAARPSVYVESTMLDAAHRAVELAA